MRHSMGVSGKHLSGYRSDNSEEMNREDIPKNVVAELFGELQPDDSIDPAWSTCAGLNGFPGATLRSTTVPDFTPPEIQRKTVAAFGQDSGAADYAILRTLGEGGMGLVFEAEQRYLSRRVALKMIRPERMHDRSAIAGFYYEAVITASLDYFGIIPILDFGVSQDGRALYAMQKVIGQPWNRTMTSMSLEENLAVLDRVVDTIAHAHGRRILHRDIKPANVMLGDSDVVWMLDWGVALHAGSGGDFANAQPGGTPQYMAPEMAACNFDQLGYRSDVYLLGATLFEILTGRPPHPGETPAECLRNAANNIIVGFSQETGFLSIAHKAMSTLPDDRHASAKEFQQALRDCLARRQGAALAGEADAALSRAIQNGGYDLFAKAMMTYEDAEKIWPENAAASQGRAKAALAYARRATANAEYDLALSIITPFIADHDKAAVLASVIRQKKTADTKRRRKYFLVALAGIALLCAAAVAVIYSNRKVTDATSLLDETSGRMDDSSKRFDAASEGIGESREFMARIRRDAELTQIGTLLPGGFFFSSVSEFDFLDPAQRELEAEELEESMKNFANVPDGGGNDGHSVTPRRSGRRGCANESDAPVAPLNPLEAKRALLTLHRSNRDLMITRITEVLLPIAKAVKAADSDREEDIAQVHKTIIDAAPRILQEIESIKMAAQNNEITKNTADAIIQNLHDLLDHPNKYVTANK